jgi:hypothetical protein
MNDIEQLKRYDNEVRSKMDSELARLSTNGAYQVVKR